jgi:O-antigen ligase
MSTTLLQFAAPKNKFQVLLDRYQYIFSIITTFLFFSNLPDYLHSAKILPVLPLTWISVFAFLTLPFIKKIATMPKPVLIWMGVYVFISVLSLITISSDEIAMKEFRTRILSLLFMCMIYAIYEQKSLQHIKYVVLAVVLMSVGNNFYELLNPRVFTELNVGRPAGFYINPNAAGCALICGLIFSIDVIKKQYRWLYLLVVFAGVMATFSRGAIIGWILCSLFLTISRTLSDRRRTVIVSMFSLVLLLALVNPFKTISDYFGSGENASLDIVERLEQLQNPATVEDDSARERKAVAGFAWIMFGERPFWGHGVASTQKWTVSEVSTHNIYLTHLADHGIVGLIILPGLICALIWQNRGQTKVQILCFAVFISLWGIFSHNVLEERYLLVIFGLLAALNNNQKWYLKYSNDYSFEVAQPPAGGKLILPPPRKQQAIGSMFERRILPPNRK